MKEKNNEIIKSLKLLPKKPGVYLFKDKSGRIIYIGKAKNLAGRVKTYFHTKVRKDYISHPITFFTSRIASLDYFETSNEIEALVLESNLIKKNRPKYNINLKDDKSYPFVAITENEEFPRVFITRNKNIRGAKYYGPYVNAGDLKDFLEALRRIFKIRDCKKTVPGKVKNSVCLNYHINLCSAPCMGKISRAQYMQNIEFIQLFLKGKDQKIKELLKNRMSDFSRNQKYEEAGTVKNQLELLESLCIGQKVFFSAENSWDVIACYCDSESKDAAVSIFTYRSGELAAINNFMVSNIAFLHEKEIISGFIKSYYSEIDNLSPVIYTPVKIDDGIAIQEWLSQIKSRKVEIRVSDRSNKKEISDMVLKNSRLYFEKKKFEKGSGYSKIFKELENLKKYLMLENIPARIECYDISNIGADFAVGSMVVFVDGIPLTGNYRHFKIRNVEGQDDFAMIAEVLRRRLKYLENEGLKIEDSFYMKPDLIIVDGGKQQLGAAKKVLVGRKITSIDLIGLAKKQETVFSDNFPDGLIIDRTLSYARIILRARDEAHRFALGYHKKLRDNHMTNSVLDGIRGIGGRKKEYVLEKYPTPGDLKACSLEDLMGIKGLTYKDALNIYNSLNRY
jgi:excinuclease ABC subunit C